MSNGRKGVLWTGVGVITLALVAWALQSVWPYVKIAGTLIVLSLGLALLKWGSKEVWEAVSDFASSKAGQFVLLTTLYLSLVWLGYRYLPGLIQAELGTSRRMTLVVITVLIAVAAPALWPLYSGIIPGDQDSARKGFMAVAIAAVILIGWSWWQRPEAYFTIEGKPRICVADTPEGGLEIYELPLGPDGAASCKGKFTLNTRRPLRRVVPDDYPKLHKARVVKLAKFGKVKLFEWPPSSRPPACTKLGVGEKVGVAMKAGDRRYFCGAEHDHQVAWTTPEGCVEGVADGTPFQDGICDGIAIPPISINSRYVEFHALDDLAFQVCDQTCES